MVVSNPGGGIVLCCPVYVHGPVSRPRNRTKYFKRFNVFILIQNRSLIPEEADRKETFGDKGPRIYITSVTGAEY